MHDASMREMKRFVNLYLDERDSLSILDVGSYSVNGAYTPLFNYPNWAYSGLDIEEGPNVDIVATDPYNWLIEDNSYDVVVSGQCLEHVEYPWLTMVEIARVLRPGGLHCNIAPSSGYVHEHPIDTFRYNPDGMRALAKWAELEVIEIGSSNDPLWKDTVLVARKPR